MFQWGENPFLKWELTEASSPIARQTIKTVCSCIYLLGIWRFVVWMLTARSLTFLSFDFYSYFLK